MAPINLALEGAITPGIGKLNMIYKVIQLNPSDHKIETE